MAVHVKVFPDMESLNAGATEWLLAACGEAIRSHGRCALALSGGSTPRGLYRLLAGEGWRGRFDWERIQIFQVDERVVPPDHPDSNFGMLQRELLNPTAIPERNVYRIRTELGAEAAAKDYELRLLESLSTAASATTDLAGIPQAAEGIPAFDIVLLGMGPDGHTASLFPETEALQERHRLVLGYRVEKLNAWRITLTLPVLNEAYKVLFFVAGGNKAATVREVFESDWTEERLPAAMVNPRSGLLYWHLDREAASAIHTGVSE